MRAKLGFATGWAFALALFTNCGDPGLTIGSLDGGGDVDSGWIADANAEAPVGVEVPCVVGETRTLAHPTVTSTYTNWYAELERDDIDPARGALVIACGYICTGPYCDPDYCPADFTCSTSGTRPAEPDCQITLGRVEHGRVLFPCGTTTTNNYTDPGTADTMMVQRWSSAYIRPL